MLAGSVRQGDDDQRAQQAAGAFLVAHERAAPLAGLDVTAQRGVAGGDLSAFGEPAEAGGVGGVRVERSNRTACQCGQQGESGLPDSSHRIVRVEPKDPPDRDRRQVVGVPQQHGDPLGFRARSERLSEAGLAGVGAGNPCAGGDLVTITHGGSREVLGPGEPPAHRICSSHRVTGGRGTADGRGTRVCGDTDRVGVTGRQRPGGPCSDELQCARLDDLLRDSRSAAEPSKKVVHPVGVHPDGGEHVLGSHHTTTLGRCTLTSWTCAATL